MRDQAIGTAEHTPYSGFAGRDGTAAGENTNSPVCLTRVFLRVRRPRVLPSEDFVATPKASRQDLIQYLALGGILLGGLVWASRPAPRLHSPLPDPRPGASMEEILVDARHHKLTCPECDAGPRIRSIFARKGLL